LAKVIGCGLASCQGKLTEVEDGPVPWLAGRASRVPPQPKRWFARKILQELLSTASRS